MVWAIIWTWVKNLDTVQIVLLSIAAFCFLIVIINLIILWWQKRNIERIPDFIEKLDVMTSNFVDDFSFNLSQEEWKNLYKDYSNILGLDLTRLFIELPKEHNQDAIDRAFDSVARSYEKNLDPKNKTAESLTYLGDMGSILDKYNAGLELLKSTPQYKTLDKKIKVLQRKAPSAYISIKVNEYYTVSDRLYIMLLGVKPLFDQPLVREKIPAKAYAKKSQIRPAIEGQVANLIAGVRESIIKYKERNKGYSEQKATEHTSSLENRETRRKRG
jgi:hypothetical protein